MAIQIRRDSAADWTSNNPTPSAGQPCYEDDTGYLKIGDGSTAWTSLPYAIVGKQSIWIPASAMIAATTLPPAYAQQESSTNDVNYGTLAFDGAADEFAHFNVAFPKSWNLGTVTARFYWTSTGTDTDAVIWGIQGMALSDNEAIDASWGTAVTVTDNLQSAAGELYISSETGAITIGGTPSAEDLCFFRVYRDADAGGDTAAEDALLIGVKLCYTTNRHNDA